MKDISAALIGLGNIAWKYDRGRKAGDFAQSQGGAMLKHEGLVLRGGCSPDPADRALFSAWAPKAAVYAQAAEMLAEIKPDLVGICSPGPEHFAHAALCLESGVKALWLEKPPTETADQLEALIVLAGRKKAVVGVNYTRRYLPLYARLKSIVDNETYGPCHLIRILYSPGLARNGVHLLDQLFYLTGAKGYELLWAEKGGGENPAFSLRLSSGQLVQGAGGNWPYHTNDLSLVCEEGIVSALHGGKSWRLEKRCENDLFPGFYDLREDDGNPSGPVVLGGHMEAALADIVGCLKNGGRPQSDLESALMSQKLLDDILREAAS